MGRDGRVSYVYGADTTGKVSYRFNSGGFRGDELDSSRPFTVYVSGCSYTFGVALTYEDTWVERFGRELASRLGKRREDFNVLNFAQGGASNDYIVRTLTTQIGRRRPDLVLALLTHSARAELLFEDGYKTIGPWALRYLDQPMDQLDEANRERVELTLDYYRCFGPIAGIARSLQSLVFLQSFLTARNIPHVLATVEHTVLTDPKLAQHPYLGPLAELVDTTKLCKRSPMDPELMTDRAEDGVHPGPRTHAEFARVMVETLFENGFAYEDRR